MAIVYVPNRGPHDYSEAKKFGELVFCTQGSLDKYDTAEMFRELTDAMYDSTEEDYLLLTSLTSLCAVAAGIFGAKHGRLNLLIHSPISNGYVLRRVILRESEGVR